MKPKISIILPTYNRLEFLESSLNSIRKQTYTDWELIIVDDGSTDGTKDFIQSNNPTFFQPVKYFYQENSGAYSARAEGLKHASGDYIAFYDSDDLWLPHHLMDCILAMQDNPSLDWVYGAAKRLIYASDEIFIPHTFYNSGRPRPLLNLNTIKNGKVRIYDDHRTLACHLEHGLYCPLQNSLIKADVFNTYNFDVTKRNGQDQIIVAKLLQDGGRIGYLNDIHTIYYIHDKNSSAAGGTRDLNKQYKVLIQIVESYEEFFNMYDLKKWEKNALRRRLCKECFWLIGYNVKLGIGDYEGAMFFFEKGLGFWPWSISCWKTYFYQKMRQFCCI